MLSIAFLQGALRARGGLSAGALTGVTVVSRHAAGHGAVVARLALTYDAAAPSDAPRSLFAKIATGDALPGARRELRFYRLIAPRLPDGLAPRLFGAAAGLEEGRIVLLYEDLLEAGYAPAVTPVLEADLLALTDTLSDLHARFWGAAWPREVDFLAPMESSTRSAQAAPQAVIDDNAATGEAAMTAFLDAHGSGLTQAEGALAAAALRFWRAQMSARGEAGNLTLIHGDFHLVGNVFLRAASPPRIIDWSEIKPGLGPHDLAYALISQPAADRLTRDTALLRRYHAGLIAAGITGYGWEQCLWDYRFSLVTNLFQSARQMNPAWMRKTLAAIADVGAEATLAQGQRLL